MINWGRCSQTFDLNLSNSLLMLTTHQDFHTIGKYGGRLSCSARCIRPSFHSESWVFQLFTCWVFFPSSEWWKRTLLLLVFSDNQKYINIHAVCQVGLNAYGFPLDNKKNPKNLCHKCLLFMKHLKTNLTDFIKCGRKGKSCIINALLLVRDNQVQSPLPKKPGHTSWKDHSLFWSSIIYLTPCQLLHTFSPAASVLHYRFASLSSQSSYIINSD